MRKGVKMIRPVWTARLNEEEQERANKEIIEKMCEELEEVWKDLKEEFLKERGQK